MRRRSRQERGTDVAHDRSEDNSMVEAYPQATQLPDHDALRLKALVVTRGWAVRCPGSGAAAEVAPFYNLSAILKNEKTDAA